MPVNFDLPDILRDDRDDAAYTSAQLEPTLARLRAAVEQVAAAPVTPQALAAAWTRIAELRLPRKAVPGPVLREIEDLVVDWGAHGAGGIARSAYSLTAVERAQEAERIRGMLAATEAAAASAPSVPRFLTE